MAEELIKVKTVMDFLYKMLVRPLDDLGASQEMIDGQMSLWYHELMKFKESAEMEGE